MKNFKKIAATVLALSLVGSVAMGVKIKDNKDGVSDTMLLKWKEIISTLISHADPYLPGGQGQYSPQNFPVDGTLNFSFNDEPIDQAMENDQNDHLPGGQGQNGPQNFPVDEILNFPFDDEPIDQAMENDQYLPGDQGQNGPQNFPVDGTLNFPFDTGQD